MVFYFGNHFLSKPILVGCGQEHTNTQKNEAKRLQPLAQLELLRIGVEVGNNFTSKDSIYFINSIESIGSIGTITSVASICSIDFIGFVDFVNSMD